MQSTISIAALKACNLFASTEDARYYLRGVLLNVYPRHSMFVATNGHIMLVHRDDLAEGAEENTLLGSWIIPSDAIKALKADKFGDATLTKLENGSLLLSTAKGDVIAKPIDGTFPDWHRVIPHALNPKDPKDAPVVQQANGHYVHAFTKAAEILDYQTTAPNFHGAPIGNPIPVTFGPGRLTFGVLMPVRSDRDEWAGMPAWAQTQQPLAIAAE